MEEDFNDNGNPLVDVLNENFTPLEEVDTSDNPEGDGVSERGTTVPIEDEETSSEPLISNEDINPEESFEDTDLMGSRPNISGDDIQNSEDEINFPDPLAPPSSNIPTDIPDFNNPNEVIDFLEKAGNTIGGNPVNIPGNLSPIGIGIGTAATSGRILNSTIGAGSELDNAFKGSNELFNQQRQELEQNNILPSEGFSGF